MSDTRWLTYDELAEALGIAPDSARRLVARKKWPRKQNNEGRALVAVPSEYLDNRPDSSPDVSPDIEDDATPDSSPDITQAVSVLTQHIQRLEKELQEVRSERDAERATAARVALQAAKVDVLEMLIEQERKRVEEVSAAERQRVEEVRETERQRVEEWKAVADRFATHAEKLAEAAEARRGWWPWRRRA
jgi:hypothetical protein